MTALIGVLLIGFGIILLARTIGQIRLARRRQQQPRPRLTVIPGQTVEWAAYLPPPKGAPLPGPEIVEMTAVADETA